MTDVFGYGNTWYRSHILFSLPDITEFVEGSVVLSSQQWIIDLTEFDFPYIFREMLNVSGTSC